DYANRNQLAVMTITILQARLPRPPASTAHAKGAIRGLDLVGFTTLRSGHKWKRAARCLDGNITSGFVRVVDEFIKMHARICAHFEIAIVFELQIYLTGLPGANRLPVTMPSTGSNRSRRSGKGHYLPTLWLVDDLVGARDQRGRQSDAKSFRGR